MNCPYCRGPMRVVSPEAWACDVCDLLMDDMLSVLYTKGHYPRGGFYCTQVPKDLLLVVASGERVEL